jgi:hypothetical protein
MWWWIFTSVDYNCVLGGDKHGNKYCNCLLRLFPTAGLSGENIVLVSLFRLHDDINEKIKCKPRFSPYITLGKLGIYGIYVEWIMRHHSVLATHGLGVVLDDREVPDYQTLQKWGRVACYYDLWMALEMGWKPAHSSLAHRIAHFTHANSQILPVVTPRASVSWV